MEKTFDSIGFLKDLAEELIDGFRKAGKATTPVLVGSAREKEVRNKLELIFPQSIGIATGCVIDSFGHTSKQTDIIVFEKDICPVFSINDTPETTYYPCEGVIAIGEIKSTLNSKDLVDSFSKIKSVKKSKRFLNDKTCWRKYCSRQTIQGANNQYYSQNEKSNDQIYGFILCEKIDLKLGTFLNKYSKLITNEESHLLPNIIVSLHDGIFVYLDSENNCTKEDKNNADNIYHVVNPDGTFQFLLSKLNYYINRGRTTDVLPFEKYIIKNSTLPGNGTMKKI
jgi:hypothetical protein